MNDTTTIARYMRGMARAKDGRGVYQNEQALYRALAPNTTPTIAAMTVLAARRVAEAISGRPA